MNETIAILKDARALHDGAVATATDGFEKREKAVKERETALDARKAKYDIQDAALNVRFNLLEKRDQDLTERERAIEVGEADLAKRRDRLTTALQGA